MTRWWRWTLALLLCGAGAVALGPAPAASAAPVPTVGLGRVVADLGTAWVDQRPGADPTPQLGFSHDGAYYAYLVPATSGCALRLYDVAGRRNIVLAHDRVACDDHLVRWAADADTMVWQVDSTSGDVTAYAWDAEPGKVSALAADAEVYAVTGVSADGHLLSFLGRSAAHPAPGVDDPRYAGYVSDRRTGVSLPLSKADAHVELLTWSPKGEHFVAATGGRTSDDLKTGACVGSGTSCRYLPQVHEFGNDVWSADGTSVVIAPGTGYGTSLYDFVDGAPTPIGTQFDGINSVQFIGADARRLLLRITAGQAVVWDRTSGAKTFVYAHDDAYPSPDGRYLMYRAAAEDSWRYLDLASLKDTAATFRGTGGYWTQDGSAFVGLGPALIVNRSDCSSSMQQWSPTTNTVSLFGPPGTATCYRPPDFRSGQLSSASGGYALFDKFGITAFRTREYVVDLRRHVLRGPVQGAVQGYARGGSDVLAVRQPVGSGTARLLLVDTTLDVHDQPRWSTETPANGARIEPRVGTQVHVRLGASEPHDDPVDLVLRWRTTAGVPVTSAPEGWSCEQKRLDGGAVVADCTFAPTALADARYLDVSATNRETRAQSDTRSYRVAVKPAVPARR